MEKKGQCAWRQILCCFACTATPPPPPALLLPRLGCAIELPGAAHSRATNMCDLIMLGSAARRGRGHPTRFRTCAPPRVLEGSPDAGMMLLCSCHRRQHHPVRCRVHGTPSHAVLEQHTTSRL